jgi:hypothetical protein
MKMVLEDSWLQTCSWQVGAKGALNDSISWYGEKLLDLSRYPTSNAARWDGKLGPTKASSLTSCRQLCRPREVSVSRWTQQKIFIETT